MKKLLLIIALVLTTAIFCLSADLAFPKNMIPADVEWVVHFDVKAFTQGRLYASLQGEAIFQKLGIPKAKFSQILGVDPIEVIDGITVIGINFDDDSPVVCITGELPRERLLSLAREEGDYREIPFGATPIHQWGRKEYGAFAGNRVLLFSEELVALKKVLGVIAGDQPSLKSADILPSPKAQSSNPSVLGFVRNVSHIIGEKGGPAVLGMIGNAAFQAGEKGNDVLMSVSFDTPSKEDAAQVEKILHGLVALASLERDNRASAFNIDPQDLSIAVKGTQVDVSLAYPIENFKKLMLGKGRFGGFAAFSSLH